MSRLSAIARRLFVLRARHVLLIAIPAFALMIHVLTTALISRFGGGDAAFPRLMNSLTGGAVCLIVLAMGVRMVVRANRALRASAA